MALDNIENRKIIETVSTPTTPTTDAGNTSVNKSNKPIDFSSKTDSNNQILEILSSPEFKQLPEEEQLKKLKSLLSGYSEDEIKQYVNNLKNKNNTQTVNETTENEVEKNTLPLDENNTEPKTSVSSSENQSELEKALLEYTKNTSTQDDINTLVAKLITKEKIGEATPEEIKILKLYNENQEAKPPKIQTTQQSEFNGIKAKDPLVSPEIIASNEWKNKTAKEKTQIFVDAYLSKYNEDYNKLSDEEKIKVINKEINDLNKLKSSDNNKNITKTDYHEINRLLGILHQSGVSLDQYKNMSTGQRQTLVRKAELNATKSLINAIPENKRKSPEWQALSGEEKLYAYADIFFNKTDAEYRNLQGKEKEIYLKNKCNDLIDQYITGPYGINWKELSEDARNTYISKTLTTIEIASENNMTIKEYMDCTPLSKLKFTQNFYKKRGFEIPEELEVENILIDSYMKNNNGAEPTTSDLIKMLEQKAKTQPLNPAEQNLLNGYKFLIQVNSGYKNEKQSSIVTLTEQAATDNYKNVNELIDVRIKNIQNIKIEKPENVNKEILRLLRETGGDYEQCQYILEKLKTDLNLSPEEIQKYQKIANSHKLKGAAKTKNAPIIVKVITEVNESGETEIAKNSTKNIGLLFKDEEFDTVATGILNYNSNLSDPLAAGMQDRSIMTLEESLKHSNVLLNSDNISNANKAIFTQDLIEHAKQNGVEEQLTFGRELSKIDNSAVTEGLAAASNSVGEEYRSQYNSYVETAMQNYPPEQQQSIRSAMQTGEISQETLSQTIPPSGRNTENTQTSTNNRSADNSSKTSGNTQQNSNAVNNASNAATNSAAQSSAAPSRTSVSNSTAASFNNTIDSPTSFTSQLRQESNITEPTYSTSSDDNISTAKTVSHSQYSGIDDDFTTEALEAKKDAAMENIKNFQEHVEESVQQSQVTEEDIQTIANLIENPENISISEEYKIRQVFKKVGTNVTAIYNIIINRYGSQVQDKFLEVLASNGSSDNIRSFVNSMRSDPSIIKKLYTHCSNQKLKSELLNMLPINDIILMITAGQIKISDLGTGNYKRVIAELKQSDPEKLNELFGEFESNINDKISSGYSLNDSDRQRLYEYLSSNIQGLSNTKFSRYLQYLPIESREELVAMKNSPKTKTPEQTDDMAESYAQNSPADNNTQAERKAEQPAGFDESQNANNIEKENKESNTQKTAQQNAQPIFKENEMTTVLNDGTKVKRKETFGAISNDTEMYDDYEEVARESATPSMNDPVLTPGSYEWQVKYNKQMAYQPITPPSNMPETDDGILLGSNKVSQRLQIDKMKRKGPFYFNA